MMALLRNAAARTILALLAAMYLSLGAGAGFAQAEDLRPQPTPASLIGVQLISESPKETRLLLTFSPKANSFGPVGADRSGNSAKPALGFALTARAN